MKRFSYFDRIESYIFLFQNPFDYRVDGVSVGLQMELIDLQANDWLKEKQREERHVKFNRYLADVEFPKLRKFAAGMASVFGTNYVCVQVFLRLRYMKSTHRTKLTDEHLKAILMIGCRNSKPNIDNTLKGKLRFHKSH